MKPEEWEEVSTPDPDLVQLCCVRIERSLTEGLWYVQIGEDIRYYHGPAKTVIMEIMREARESYPDLPPWLSPANYIRMPGLRDLAPDPQLAALLEEEENIGAVVVFFDIYVRDGRGVGVGVCQNSILVRDRPPPPTLEEFSTDGVRPLPRPRYAWLFALGDRALRQGTIGVFFACCTAAGAGLYRGDVSAAAWIILAVAVDLLQAELRRAVYELGGYDG